MRFSFSSNYMCVVLIACYSITSNPLSSRLCTKRMGWNITHWFPHHRCNCPEDPREDFPSPCNFNPKVRAKSYLLCLCSLLSDVSSFATLSCISSLAVAPMLPIWKLRARDYYRREIARHTLTYGSDDDDHVHALETQFYLNTRKKKIRDAQNRGRVILSLALLIQVCTTHQTKHFVPF